MAEPIYVQAGANVEVTDTFATWIATTNSLVYDMGTKVLTTTQYSQPNTSVGGYVAGNSHVEGIFSANTLTTATQLRGGTVSTAADLKITSNVAFNYSPSILITSNTENFTVNANNTTVTGNLAINSIKTVLVSAANTTINAGSFYVRTDSEFTGNRVDIDSPVLDVTSNATFTSATLNANVDVITLGFNASDTLNVNSISEFNANVNIDGILSVTANVAFTGSNTTVTALESTGEIRLKGTSARTIKTQSTNGTQQSLNVSLANTSVTITPLVVSSTNVGPGANTTYDLGSNLVRWNKEFVKDTDVANSAVIANQLSVSGNVSFTGANTTVTALEATDEIRLKGASKTIKVQNTNATQPTLNLSIANTSVTVTPLTANSSSVAPGANNMYDLGVTGTRWNKAWVKDVDVANTVIIATDSDVGRDMIVRRDLYVYGNTSLSSSATLSLNTSNITDLNVLGTLSMVTGARIDTDFIPQANTTYSLGTNLLRWATLFANTVTANTFTGDLTGAVTGNASTATTLQTARTINGVSFNGSANITITANTNNTLSIGSYLTGSNFNGSTATTWAVDATTTNTASKIVARDVAGSFAANVVTASSLVGPLTGNASTATTLQTARTINGVSFNGSANITITANTNATLSSGAYIVGANFDGSTARTWNVDATDLATASKVVARDASGNFAANTITAALTGNASTATALKTARTINGVSFDGTGNITVTANTNNTLTIGAYLTGSNFNGSAATTWAVDATNLATASKVVARDASGNFAANTITAALTGNASTATTLQTARTINGVSFNGSANITITANTNAALTAGTYLTGSAFTGSTATTWAVDATDLATASKVVARDASGNFAANTVTAVLFSGSGASLTALNGSNISTGTVADARIATTIARTSTTITAGDGLSGGGDISANRTLAVDTTVVRTSGAQDIAGQKTFNSTMNTNAIVPNANVTYNVGTSNMRFLNMWANTFNGTATTAQYADLAEKYHADAEYPIGTVIAVGGPAEITAATDELAHSVIGVVSANPAYLMNSDLENGTAVALKGRVPVRVTGEVMKGDRLVPSAIPGVAEANNSMYMRSFAISLETGTDIVEAIIL